MGSVCFAAVMFASLAPRLLSNLFAPFTVFRLAVGPQSCAGEILCREYIAQSIPKSRIKERIAKRAQRSAAKETFSNFDWEAAQFAEIVDEQGRRRSGRDRKSSETESLGQTSARTSPQKPVRRKVSVYVQRDRLYRRRGTHPWRLPSMRILCAAHRKRIGISWLRTEYIYMRLVRHYNTVIYYSNAARRPFSAMIH